MRAHAQASPAVRASQPPGDPCLSDCRSLFSGPFSTVVVCVWGGGLGAEPVLVTLDPIARSCSVGLHHLYGAGDLPRRLLGRGTHRHGHFLPPLSNDHGLRAKGVYLRLAASPPPRLPASPPPRLFASPPPRLPASSPRRPRAVPSGIPTRASRIHAAPRLPQALHLVQFAACLTEEQRDLTTKFVQGHRAKAEIRAVNQA